jgi:Spy/CpxP family protein refolding chaperone
MIRNLIIPIAALVLAAAPMHAQDRTAARQRTPEDAATRAQRRTEHMRTTLQLTEDQVALVQAINLKHAEAVEAARAADKAQRDQERQELKAGYDADLKAVLTPEQYERLLEQRRKQTEKREARPATARPAHQE